ncbi:MAG TPA: serine/threonine-protein phosphatase [Verrucomicrobiales bacterium]|nr:serine/threonine-protein phosphatase [Verrucomicrobiales bacterium]
MGRPDGRPPSTQLRWFGWTDVGKVRKNNEDSFLGLQFDSRETRHLGKFGDAPTDHFDYAFAVSDGMGGAMAGEFASRIAVEKITTLLPRSFQQSAAGLSSGFGDVLEKLFDDIHRALVFVGNSYTECSGMETTLSLCWFTPGWMYFGHVGDSRIYYLPGRERAIRQLTQDDTHVAWLLRNQMISPWEARTHPRRNVLQKALGGGNQFVDPQVGAVALEPGDLFLICSDGLTEGLSEEHLLDLLRPPAPGVRDESPARRLVTQAVANDGRDNTTALLIEAL